MTKRWYDITIISLIGGKLTLPEARLWCPKSFTQSNVAEDFNADNPTKIISAVLDVS